MNNSSLRRLLSTPNAAVFLLVFANCSIASAKEKPSALAKIVAESKCERYQSSSRKELQSAELLFVKTLHSQVPLEQLRDAWRELDWQLSEIRLETAPGNDGERVLVLHEMTDAMRGRGLFAIRPTAKLPIALQAPHSFFDRGTQAITVRIFEETSVTAAGWNTVRRSVMDAAHRKESYLNAFTRALLQAPDHPVIVQLHGFSKNNRKTDRARNSQVIVSNGTRFPGRSARSVANGLATAFGADAVRLYPSQVGELGGTKNSQARIVHQHGSDRFLHIELSREFRKNLLDRYGFRHRFNTHFTSSLTIAAADTR